MSTCVQSVRYSCLAAMVAMAACGADRKDGAKTEPAPAANAAASTAATPPAPAVAPPPPAVTQASWAPDALEELLAPIALYPDQLLMQILAASVNTQEVLDGGNWLLDNQSLQADALDAAAQGAGFGAAMRALLQFPTVVDMLCQQIDWTRQVGSAFSSDQKSVLDAVQRLRLQAAQVGNLKSTPEQTVETKTENNQTIVEVKPADPQVVYVPQYNPQVVYTTPPPAQPAPATTSSDDDDTVSTETAVAAGLIGFGVGAILGSALDDDDDDYCCYPNWGHSTVVVGTRPFYPPAYAYRPAYGAGFRPAYGYNPPAGYRYNSASHYNRTRQGNTNIDVNNSNYFNRFDNNQNLRAGTAESPLAAGNRAQDNRAQGNRAQGGRPQSNEAQSWKGQSSYRGARDGATTQGLNKEANERRSAQSTQARADGMRAGTSSTERASYSNERATRDTQANGGPKRSANVDRGYGDTPRTQTRDAGMQRPATDTQRAETDIQRSDPGSQRPDMNRERPEPAAAGAPERTRDSTFSGARDSGSFERSASSRGRASSGGRAGGGRRR
jgi:hypothetical protein